MLSLFENEGINNFSNQYLLRSEKLNGIQFFDPKKDQVSFFYFGLNSTKVSELLDSPFALVEGNEFYKSFLEKFIWEPSVTWKDYRLNNPKSNITDYIHNLWSNEKPKWGNGISLSNLIYPLGIDVLKNSNYAEEYIVIILSDFLTGAELGNKQDLELLKNTLKNQQQYDSILSKFNQLAGKFHKIDYFDYEFKAGYKNGKQNLLGVLGYKIRPNTGKRTPDDTWLFLDSDVSLNQNSYETNSFSLSPQNLKFAHNNDLEIDNVKFTLSDNNDNVLNSEFLDYTKSFDKNNIPIYQFEETNLDLSTIYSFKNAQEKSPFIIDYTFYSTYNLYANSSLKFAYKVPSRNILLSSNNFRTKTSIIVMTYILPTTLLLLIIHLLFYFGKPIKIKAKLTRFTDSYETIGSGQSTRKLQTDYIGVTSNDKGFVEFLKISGKVLFRKNKLFSWSNVKVTAEISSIEKKPEKLEIYLKRNLNSNQQYYADNKLGIISKNNEFSFLLYFVNNDPLYEYTIPKEVKLNILIKIPDKRLFWLKANVKEEVISYHFQIGPELGDVWIGIDPGTSGTCIATANSPDKIIMIKDDNAKEVIMPSIISFNPNNNIEQIKFPNYPEHLFRFGLRADQRPNTDIKFQSVKKLLGYKDKKVVKLNDGKIFLSGKELTALLINGAFKELNNYVSEHKINFDTLNAYNPKRAVVAVPNNFTMTKISDMIHAFDNVFDVNGKKQFDEIRYVYEAEAILFNYVSNYSVYNTEELNDENILIFDMGGATINVTIVNVNTYYDSDGQLRYRSNVLGKLGYGIGGDTIDYVLIKILYEHTRHIPILNNYLKNAFDKDHEKRVALKSFTLELKKIIIKNKENKKEYILNPTELSTTIKNKLSIDVSFSNDEIILKLIDFKEHFKSKIKDLERKFKAELPSDNHKREVENLKRKLNSKNKTLLNHPIFEKYILANVRSAVNDVVDLSNTELNTVIFSGRSVFFPKVKETVLNSVENEKTISLTFDDSKTAVAKGACWYGVNKSRIELNNIKTNGVFGFKHGETGTGMHGFVSLVDFGARFNSNVSTPVIHGKESVNSDFGLNNNHVEFYQIMGKNTSEILNNDELSHKRSKLARIRADHNVDEVSISVFENDNVDCRIKLVTGKIKKAKNIISDMEIAKENEEHYTWYIS